MEPSLAHSAVVAKQSLEPRWQGRNIGKHRPHASLLRNDGCLCRSRRRRLLQPEACRFRVQSMPQASGTQACRTGSSLKLLKSVCKNKRHECRPQLCENTLRMEVGPTELQKVTGPGVPVELQSAQSTRPRGIVAPSLGEQQRYSALLWQLVSGASGLWTSRQPGPLGL